MDFSVEVKKEGAKVQYHATLEGQITAKDVAGRDVPGLDEIVLDKIEVTNDELVADLEFADTKGEIAAFHPQGFDKAVMAFTIDKLAFSNLVPSALGGVLDGVSVDDLTIMVVPAKGQLKPGDKAIPERINKNITTVLSDSGENLTQFIFANRINLFAELDFSLSPDMVEFFNFIGGNPKSKVPIFFDRQFIEISFVLKTTVCVPNFGQFEDF